MSDQNWRTDVDAGDYFLHQKKQLQVADRRPVIRQASDIGLGPGIGASAVRLDDYNDLLATFNGYYAAVPGALNAPDSILPLIDRESFVGQVISDATLGGQQIFTGLVSGSVFRRTFNRSSEDPEAIGWGPWTGGQRVLPSAQGYAENDTELAPDTAVLLVAPDITTIGDSDVYERTDAGIMLRRQGVYTGVIQIGDRVGATTAEIFVYLPDGGTTTPLGQLAVPLGPTVHIPFTVWAVDIAQGFSVVAEHSESIERDLWWRFSCTRVGDAV